MIVNRSINRQYDSINSTERYKAITLFYLLLLTFIFCVSFSIREITSGQFFSNPGYYIISILSPFLAWMVFRGHYKFTVYATLIGVSLAISFSQLYGEYREIEILTFILLISFSSIYTNRKVSLAVTLYFLAYLILLYYVKKETQDFSTAYLPYSLFLMVLISAVAILNTWILERNIGEIREEVIKRTKELNVAKEYAELLFRNNPSAVYTVDHNGKILDFNRKAEELTGIGKEEMVGKNETVLDPLREKGLTDYRFEKSGEAVGTLISKEGKVKTIARYSTLLTKGQGVITGKIVSFTDLTEWREFERYKADMERVIRHDLKTPLNTVIGFPALMLQNEKLDSESRDYLNYIRNAGLIMKSLIESSQSLYKIEEGSYEPEMQSVDLFSVLRQIIADLTELKSRKKINLRLLLDDAEADENRELKLITEKLLIQMILTNLIKNALEASPAGAEVTISVFSKYPHSMTIHNRGAIPEEIRDTFFDKYVTKNKKSGTGLGTYSAKLMSQAIGADLTFSTGEKEGTTLRFSFNE